METTTETTNPTATPKRSKRDRGTGSLQPPKIGVTGFWTAQCVDRFGKTLRRSTKVRGKLKAGCDPKLPESWSGIQAAKDFLEDLVKEANGGTISVGNDPAHLHYSDIRKLYMNDYSRQERKSLMQNAETGADYVCGLKWLDEFFGYDAANDKSHGVKVIHITDDMLRKFEESRKTVGASNGTINRSLAALRRMSTLAIKAKKLQHPLPITMLPEPKQPRQGFLSAADYQRLYDALGVEVKNESKGTSSRPFAYVQPLLQTGYHTGMRLSEILNLRWANVDLKDELIHLFAGETKNDEARDIPMVDGLPAMFESLRRANPTAGPNDLVFTNEGKPIASFLKAWRKACIRAATPTTINGQVVVSHFDGAKYCGFLFHDLRRTFVSNMVSSGVDPLDAMSASGHKTASVFARYNIKSKERAKAAGRKLSEHMKRKAAESEPAPVKLTVVK
jgi:integrase